MRCNVPERSLANLLKVRHTTVTEAQAALAVALAAEQSACATEAAATMAIRDELATASAEAADDATVEAIAAWLRSARTRQTEARGKCLAAELVTEGARAALAAARAAEAAVEGLIEAREEEARTETRRRSQIELNEHVVAHCDNQDECRIGSRMNVPQASAIASSGCSRAP